jgi:hypothetical protein
MAKAITNYDSGKETPLAADGFKPLYWRDVLAIYQSSL